MKEVDPVETVLKARRIPGCEYQGEWPSEPEDSAMREPMSDERLKEHEDISRLNQVPGERLAEACREIRRLRAELDALNKPRTLDVLREQSELCRELKATIEGHEAALREALEAEDIYAFDRAKRAIRARLVKP